jgi:flagellar basal body rod protein FlgG
MDTGNPGDLAMTHSGFFVVRNGDSLLYTRQGQFHRDSDGRLVTAQGWAVQADGGGDIILKTNAFKVAEDGTVTESGQPIARLAVMDFIGRRDFSDAEAGFIRAPDNAMKTVDAPAIRQGALETSNVSTADEMVGMMEAIRRAEAGQRLVNTYDDLMGRVLSTFGQA